MAVYVHIPTRISVDPGALVERQACIEEALAQAALRALRNSRKEALEKRGGYLAVDCHRPDFTWTGDGLDHAHPELRAIIEERIAKAFSYAVDKAGLYDLAEATQGVFEPMSGEVSEVLDSSRYSEVLGLYGIPGYDDKGKVWQGKVIDFGPEEGEIDLEIEHAPAWEKIPTGEKFEDLLIAEMDEKGRDFPTSGFLGVIYKSTDGNMYIAFRQFPSSERIGDPYLDLPIEDLKDISFRKGKLVTVGVKLPPYGDYKLSFYALAGTVELNTQALEKFFGDFIYSTVKAAAEKTPAYANLKPDELEGVIKKRAEEHITDLVTKVSKEAKCFLELKTSVKSYLLVSRLDMPTGLDIELIPLTTMKERKRKGKKGKLLGTGGAGAGAGRRAGEDTGAGKEAGEDGTGEGEGAQGGERGDGMGEAGGEAIREGFIYTGEGEGTAGMRFPTFSGGRVLELVCRPFLNEPSVDELGADGTRVGKLIEEIAYKLQIPTCKYAAQFCLNAAAALGGRAIAVGSVAVNEDATTKPVEVGGGNLGSIQFTPVASTSIQLMRHLARVTSDVTDLMNLLGRLYRKPEHFSKIKDEYIDVPAAWQLRFHIELTDLMKESVASIFVVTCRVLLLQLLRSSKAGIKSRLDPKNFENFAMLFEVMVGSHLASVDYLIGLRDKLKARETQEKLGLLSSNPDAWLDLTKQVTGALSKEQPKEPAPTGPEGEVVKVGGEYFIRDARNKMWSKPDLETAIAFQRGMAESIDPIIKQITDVPEVVERVKANPDGARRELQRILEEMETNNQEMIEKVSDDYKYAFRASKIQEHLPAATIPGTTYALQGIHLQAHEQIGEFFRGSPYYAAGIDSLFSAELGAAALTNFFVFTGLIFLSIVCPPLAYVVGIGVALHDYNKALERERLYGSMIDPELVLTRAEVEAELFAAKLGLVLSFIPEAGSILKGAQYGVKAVSRAGLMAGARIMGRYVVRRVTKQMIEALAEPFFKALVREVVADRVMDAVITKALEPLMAHIQRETMITGPVGGIEGGMKVAKRIKLEQMEARLISNE